MAEDTHRPLAAVEHFEDQHSDKDLEVFAIRDFGSKSKNMDGPDSDIDALFLFDQPAHQHKQLGGVVDNIDPDNEMYGMDLHGWNLRKFADLVEESNPSVIEFLNSPVSYYRADPEVSNELENLRAYVNENFNPIGLYYHYQSNAKSNYNKYILRKLLNENTGERFRILDDDYNEGYLCYRMGNPEDKRHIYKGNLDFRECTTDRTVSRNLKVVRATLYARHMRLNGTFPTMNFQKFLGKHVEEDIAETVNRLLELKMKGSGDEEVGNPFERLIEDEISREPDTDDFEHGNIEREKVNEFINNIDNILFG